MKRLFSVTLAALAVLSMTSSSATEASQEKIRIAFWEFENHAEQRYWFHSEMGDAARNFIDTAFSDDPDLSARFSVIERERLELVLKEQGLSSAGAVDPQTVANVGRILGVRYIVTGGIDKFAINTTRGGFGGIGGSSTNAEATINLRFIDSTTAERVISVSADGNVRKGGGFFKGASLSRDDEWGIASEAIEAASIKVVEELVSGNNLERVASAAAGGGGIDMRIVRIDGARAIINVGQTSGIKVGDRFTIHRKGEDLIDPASGMNLGAVEEQVGTGVVVEVQERFSFIEFTGSPVAADVIKKAG